MADMYAVSSDALTDIAEAIRLKRDITDGIPVADMAMQIGLIGGGGLEWIGETSVDTSTENGSLIFPQTMETDANHAYMCIPRSFDLDSTNPALIFVVITMVRPDGGPASYRQTFFIVRNSGYSNALSYTTIRYKVDGASAYRYTDGFVCDIYKLN